LTNMSLAVFRCCSIPDGHRCSPQTATHVVAEALREFLTSRPFLKDGQYSYLAQHGLLELSVSDDTSPPFQINMAPLGVNPLSFFNRVVPSQHPWLIPFPPPPPCPFLPSWFPGDSICRITGASFTVKNSQLRRRHSLVC